MAAKQSQRVKILNWLYDGNRITGLEALHRFGCMRLSARILELKDFGYQIEDRVIEVEDQDTGKTKHVKEYWLYFPPEQIGGGTPA